MKKLCKNCKHYTKPRDDYDKKYDLGKCDCDKFVYQADSPLNDRLGYWDYEGYSAGFDVGGNFGCIYFINKD